MCSCSGRVTWVSSDACHTRPMSDRHDAHGYWLPRCRRRPAAVLAPNRAHRRVVIVGWRLHRLWTASRQAAAAQGSAVVPRPTAVARSGGCNGGFVNGLWFSFPNARAVWRRGAPVAPPPSTRSRDRQHAATGRRRLYRQVATCRSRPRPPGTTPGSRPRGSPCARRAGRLVSWTPSRCSAAAPAGLPRAALRRRGDRSRRRLARPGAAVRPRSSARANYGSACAATAAMWLRRPSTGGSGRGGDHGVRRALAHLPGAHRLTVTSSHIVITEPVLSCSPRSAGSGSASPTRGRSTTGRRPRAGSPRLGRRGSPSSRTHGHASTTPAWSTRSAATCAAFPGLEGKRITMPGGPIDVSPTHRQDLALEPGIHRLRLHRPRCRALHMFGRSLARWRLGATTASRPVRQRRPTGPPSCSPVGAWRSGARSCTGGALERIPSAGPPGAVPGPRARESDATSLNAKTPRRPWATGALERLPPRPRLRLRACGVG
jgi:hypothetical protein